MVKRVITNSKLTNRQIKQLIEYFALEVPALRASKAMEINRHSAERVYQIIRRCLALRCEEQSPFGGEVECDESYFGGKRHGKRGRGAANKVPVFGLLKRKDMVYTRIVNDVSRETLRKIIRSKVIPESIIFTDSFRSYDGLVLDGFKHYRINHQKAFAYSKQNHINGIENFWGYAKTKLRKYNGVSRKHFYFYLKEMEFRYNNRKSNNLNELVKHIVIKYHSVLD